VPTSSSQYRLPKSIELIGLKWTVQWDDKLMELQEAYGLTDFDKLTISLDSSLKDRKELAEHTFWHEKMHAITFSMGRKDLDEDEAFIDTCASLILQSTKSAKYHRKVRTNATV
jgi:hypothetical protein